MKNILYAILPNTGKESGSILSLISEATPVGKVVMLILLIFSIISWAVIIFKLVEYKNARKNSTKFIEFFRKTKNFSEINKFAAVFKNNPIAILFKYGYKDLSMQIGPNKTTSEDVNLDSINRSLLRASKNEIVRLEHLNGFLATTATVTPFIGLFGTVWGIMTSFQRIGLQMNANLSTVAPGIADALIATALGLFAAIPAVIFYNLLLNKMKIIISTMEDFSLEFLNVSEKLK